MFRIAICDDEPEQLLIIRAAVKEFFSTRREHRHIVSEYGDPLALRRSIEEGRSFDILLLDTCMPGLSGMDIVRVSRRRCYQTEAIFLSASGEYAVDAFGLKAAHYLVKPFSQKQFDEAMERALKNLAAARLRTITVKLEGGNVRTLDMEEIVFIESSAHTQNIHMKNGGCVTAKQSMALLAEQLETLSPGQFVSPFKGYIINFHRVAAIDANGATMQDGTRIPIAKRSFRELRDKYFGCMFADGSGKR
ncbi:Transcriptional regulatory protein NatR [bioreactor metagenome]|uniref:Transcriptional regulatory protein NatR n=1 Tax=bioreactor metagenome TaxID=1076179 RepID=A0A645EMQ6_9ZZZZ|nr:LytTR family DNA-binding domain-containing protein [Cloacibacillus evryensis]